MKKLKGIPAANGIVMALGKRIPKKQIQFSRKSIEPHETEKEIEHLIRALEKTKKELGKLRHQVSKLAGKTAGEIFDSHIAMLSDELMLIDLRNSIRNNYHSAEYAFWKYMNIAIKSFSKSSAHFGDRRQDLEDLIHRVHGHLSENPQNAPILLEEPRIILAHDLSPSDTVHLNTQQVLGFATLRGGRTSHTAILARSLGIPAVVGVKGLFDTSDEEINIIIDGNAGMVILDPDKETVQHYEKKRSKYLELERLYEQEKDQPAVTPDGVTFEIRANIETNSEIEQVLNVRADGVGLFRSEYLFLNQTELPNEDEQLKAYRELVSSLNPQPVTIRTLDVGGDKMISHLQSYSEDNPYLGCRAIRFSLRFEKAIFRTQIRALLRASSYGNLSILLPMISSLEEFRRAKEIIEEEKTILKENGYNVAPYIPLGIMVEVPSAAILAESFAREADFLSIGNNDLIQYTVAVDRGNETIAHLYRPLHPAVLRLIQMTIEAGRKHQVPVSMCGEFAANVENLVFLIGSRIDSFSVNTHNVLAIKKLIRKIPFVEAQKVFEHACSLETATDVENYLLEMNHQFLPELLLQETEGENDVKI